ncbi:MAG: glycosyltransferase [Alphaproteobacteria bacterium]
MRTPNVDIVMIADWRQAGPVFWYQRNLAEAALAAGYRLAVLQVDGRRGAARAGVHPWLRAMVDRQRIIRLDPAGEAEAALSLTVDDTLLEGELSRPLGLIADVNLAIRIAQGGGEAGDGARSDPIDMLEMQLRRPVVLAAATDLIAAELPGSTPAGGGDAPIWRPAIDVDAFGGEGPQAPLSGPPVVGSCVDGVGELDSRLFGWRHRALRLRGPKAALLERRQAWPAGWRIEDVADRPLSDFCRSLHAYLEGFAPKSGKDALCAGSILTAASGGLVLAPPGLEPYLGGIATTSDAPAAAVDALAEDAAGQRRSREKVRAALLERHDWRCHRARLSELIGAPRQAAVSLASPSAMPRRRALFFSTNGVGMGHLTRQLAIARRLPASIEPVFLSMSQACGQVEKFGFPVEYTPYHAYYDGHVDHWNAHLTHLLHEMIAFYDPAVLMFDGNYPFRALINARRQHPERAFVWCRRGLWQPGQNAAALDRAALFDLVIEPLDLATVFDRGPTKSEQGKVRCIPPIRLLEPEELDDRETAAAALGLDADKPAVLLQLGSRNNYELAPLVDRLLPALRAVDGLQIATMQWLISEQDHGWPDDVQVLSGYPMARHIAAFDFSIATPGYNSFHELVAYGVPTVFIPNEHPSMDDHVARAHFAERQGFGFGLRRSEVYKIAPVIEAIGQPGVRARMRAAARRHATPNGAGLAARAVADLVHSVKGRGEPADIGRRQKAGT